MSTSTDTANCGTCGHACTSTQICAAGVCACSSGQTLCGGTCVSTSTDNANCGTCGHACTTGQACTAGVCTSTCASGTTLCSGNCTNLLTDATNCGVCGRACGSGLSCTAGVCAGCGATVSLSTQVQPIFTASCTTGCHGGARPAAGMSLLSGAAYSNLVGVAASGCTGGQIRVVRGSVSTSYLVNKLTGVGMCSGSAMPFTGGPLPTAQLDLIRTWICNGAPNN